MSYNEKASSAYWKRNVSHWHFKSIIVILLIEWCILLTWSNPASLILKFKCSFSGTWRKIIIIINYYVYYTSFNTIVRLWIKSVYIPFLVKCPIPNVLKYSFPIITCFFTSLWEHSRRKRTIKRRAGSWKKANGRHSCKLSTW